MAGALRTWSGRLVARPWLLGFVPINAATAGFGVVLPLLILIPLHGSWTDVALAATLFNISVTLSSVLWGHLSDTYPRRRLFLVINYAGYAGLYVLLAHIGSMAELFVAYTIVGAIAPAGASASNLLILEKFAEEDRAVAFASFQEMSMLGSIVGLLVGYFWMLGSGALVPLLYVLAVLAGASAAALWFGIRDPEVPVSTRAAARHTAGRRIRRREQCRDEHQRAQQQAKGIRDSHGLPSTGRRWFVRTFASGRIGSPPALDAGRCARHHVRRGYRPRTVRDLPYSSLNRQRGVGTSSSRRPAEQRTHERSVTDRFRAPPERHARGQGRPAPP